MPARVVIQKGPTADTEYVLRNDVTLIGRSADNDIVVNDAEVSRRHTQIIHQQSAGADQYLVEDMGSTNGTFVNGLRCNGRIPLADGDQIELGESVRMVFMRRAATPAPTPRPSAEEEDELDTADLPPLPMPPPAAPLPPVQAAPAAQPAAAPATSLPADEMVETSGSTARRVLIGCGVTLLVVACICVGTVFFLDWYQQGRLLYCGGLRPFWEILIGPNFNPVCP